MNDTVSINLVKAIREAAELKLCRNLSEQELRSIGKPRSYIGLEAILDYLKSSTLSQKDIEKYLKSI
jgi:hypothetical protein